MRTITAILLVAAGLTSTLSAADTNAPLRKTAIIVENRAGEQFNDKVSVLEDLLSSRVAGKGFSIISRDVATSALKNYASAGVTMTSQSGAAAQSGTSTDRGAVSMEVNAGQKDAASQAVSQSTDASATKSKYNDNYSDTTKPENKKKPVTYLENENETTTTQDHSVNASAAAGATHDEATSAALHAEAQSTGEKNSGAYVESHYASAHVAATPDTTALDEALNNNTSALRLAQNLGADFILIPAITSYGTEKKAYNGNGISTVNVTHTLRVSYKIVEAGMGGAMRGGMVAATKTIRKTEGLETKNSDLINSLLDDAAT